MEREIFAKNLIKLRKEKNLTQSELAERLNYSDKTVSKWENGDALPDVNTLFALSEFFGVSMDVLYAGDLEKHRQNEKSKDKKSRWNKSIITLMAAAMVWFAVVLAYVCIKLFLNEDAWMLFIYGAVLTFIVLLVFNSIWGKRVLNYLIISLLIWSCLLALHLQMLSVANIWPIYFVGIPLQILTILWSQLKKRVSKRNIVKGE